MERSAARSRRRRHRSFRDEELVQRADYFCPQRNLCRGLHRNRINSIYPQLKQPASAHVEAGFLVSLAYFSRCTTSLSEMTTHVKPRIATSSVRHASPESPALRQVSAKNCSRLSLCSMATCGSSNPRRPSVLTIKPCLPSSISETRRGAGRESSESSTSTAPRSSSLTGGKRGSRSAAPDAQCAMLERNGSLVSTTPMHPRNFPCTWTVTNTPHAMSNVSR